MNDIRQLGTDVSVSVVRLGGTCSVGLGWDLSGGTWVGSDGTWLDLVGLGGTWWDLVGLVTRFRVQTRRIC